MADSEGSGLDLTQVLERFASHASLIRQLVVVDETFWTMCEEYALVRTTLARLQAPSMEKQDALKIAEYATLATDLEREITDALRLREENGG